MTCSISRRLWTPKRNPAQACACGPTKPNLGEAPLGPEGRALPPPQVRGLQIKWLQYHCGSTTTKDGLCSVDNNLGTKFKHHFAVGRRPILLRGKEIRGRVKLKTDFFAAGVTDAPRMSHSPNHNAALRPVGVLEWVVLENGKRVIFPAGTMLMTDENRDCLYIRET